MFAARYGPIPRAAGARAVAIRFNVDHAARRAGANADMDAAVIADANSECNATHDHALEAAATTKTGLRSTRRWWPTGTRQREAAARLAAELGVRASADTVLRELRRAAVTIRSKNLPRIVGIDDRALAKRHCFLATT
ncbi:MAG: hypothetical protein ABWY12_12665 [Burkholderiales bacterium]